MSDDNLHIMIKYNILAEIMWTISMKTAPANYLLHSPQLVPFKLVSIQQILQIFLTCYCSLPLQSRNNVSKMMSMISHQCCFDQYFKSLWTAWGTCANVKLHFKTDTLNQLINTNYQFHNQCALFQSPERRRCKYPKICTFLSKNHYPVIKDVVIIRYLLNILNIWYCIQGYPQFLPCRELQKGSPVVALTSDALLLPTFQPNHCSFVRAQYGCWWISTIFKV